MEKAGARGVEAKTCLNFRPPPALCLPLWHSTYEVSRKKGFCSPAPQLIAEFPPKVGHSICLSWLLSAIKGLCKRMVLGKRRVPYTTCCMYSRAKLPSHHLPRLFGSLVTSAGARRLGVLLVHLGRQSRNLLHQVATMSSGRFSRFCNSGGPRHWAGAAIVSGTPVPCPLCNVLVPSSGVLHCGEHPRGSSGSGLEWVSPS